MKKLANSHNEILANFGKPPKGAVFQRATAAELGAEFFRNAPKTPVAFKETTHKDFVRIIAEVRNRSKRID